MATPVTDTAGGDGPEIAKETTRLIDNSVQIEHASTVQRHCNYESLHSSMEASVERSGRRHLIGDPQPSQDDDSLEVVIQDDQSMAIETTNDLQCLMHLLKGNIGTGMLAMPIAVSHSGLWTGLAGILFVGLVATHCMHLLVKSSKMLSRRTGGLDALDYADVMEMSLKTGPQRLRSYASFFRLFVNGLLLFTQFGFCCVYIVFISTSIKDVVEASYPNSPDLRIYELATTGLLLLYCMIKDLRTLAPFSFIANILTLGGMVLIFMYILQGLPAASERPAFTDIQQLPLFFGTAIFSFEGISLVLPLESSMRDRERFSGLSGVLNLSMVSVTCLYAAMGFYGFLKFGSAVKDSITLSLPSTPCSKWCVGAGTNHAATPHPLGTSDPKDIQGEVLYYLIVKPMFAITIFVSYNIQFYVPIRIIVPWLADKLHYTTQSQKNRLEYLLRTFFVVLTMAFAMAIPHLDLLISLIGALASSSLALILPVLIHTLTILTEPQRPHSMIIVKNILISIVGIFGFLTGTYTSLREIINTF